jgi:hypothetical protein
MGGWALSSVTYAVTLMSDALNWLLMISAVPSALSIVTGVVLGILGLVELGGVTRPTSGRGQAIGSLIVGTVFLIAIAFGSIRSGK